MSQKVQIYANHEDAHSSISSRDIQPNQPGCPARLDLEDPAPTIGIEHHASEHLRLDGHGAVDADRRTGAHVSGKAVRARRDQYLVDGAVADGRSELRDGAHQDFAQMPAVQHEGRHLGRGPCGRSCWLAVTMDSGKSACASRDEDGGACEPSEARTTSAGAVFHPLVLPGRREAGAKGGGAGAGDSSGGAEEDEDAEVHSTRRRL
eukprot:scaffold101375_cov60-Phaeocystis_antarctica.AAC.2